MPVTVTKDRVPEVLKAIDRLVKSQLLIGIPAENATREPEPGEKDVPNNAVLAYINEFGAPERNIPPRPHLIPAVESILDKAIPQLKTAGNKALSGDKEAVDQAFNKIGLIGQNAVRAKIMDGPFVPLSPVTVYKRKHRKVAPRDSDRPLVDTGKMRDAYTYVIRVKGQ